MTTQTPKRSRTPSTRLILDVLEVRAGGGLPPIPTDRLIDAVLDVYERMAVDAPSQGAIRRAIRRLSVGGWITASRVAGDIRTHYAHNGKTADDYASRISTNCRAQLASLRSSGRL